MILLSGHSLTRSRKVPMEKLSLRLSERNSTASMVPADMSGINTESWFLDETNPGAGIVWRVRSIQTAYAINTPTVTLEHIINTLKDRIIFGEIETKDISGNDTCTAEEAVRFILDHQTIWRLGSFGYDVSGPYKFNGDTLFDALVRVTRSLDNPVWTYDMSQYPFVLNINPMPSGVGSEMRAGRNISAVTQTIDKSSMYTRFYPIGKDALHINGDYVSQNEGIYGVICKTEVDQSFETEEDLRAWANERLRKHAMPAVTVEVEGLELADATGESLDRIRLGRLCRIPLPEFGTTIEERVTELNYQDKVHQPEVVTVKLSNQAEDVTHDLLEVISEAIKEGAGPSGSGRAGGGGRGGASQSKKDHAWFEDTDEHVAMCAEGIIGVDANGEPNWVRLSQIVVDGKGIHQTVEEIQNGNIIRDAKIEVNERQIAQEVSDRSEMGRVLQGKITVEADRITQEVSRASVAEGALRGAITVEANRITEEVQRANFAEGALRGAITVEANRITQEVTRASAAEGVLDGKITVEAGKITQIVTAVGSNGQVTAASICLAINNGGSSATINADKIYLLGQTIANTVTANYIDSQISTLATLHAKDITANTITAGVNFVLPNGLYLSANGVWQVDLTQSGDTYTLKEKKLNGDEREIGTFSRATTLSGAWSSGVFTVSASPQGNSKTTSLSITNVHKGVVADDENAKHMYAKVSATIDSAATVYDTGKEIDLNASSIYDDGKNYADSLYGQWNSGVQSTLYYFDTTKLSYKVATGSGKRWYYKS